MNESVTDSEVTPEAGQQVPIAIGQQLREARIAMGSSVAEVASKLKLYTSIIDAIENDDFSNLPEPIFVCGYLRSYAGLVNIPADPLVNAYTTRGHDTPPIVSRKKVKSQVSSKHKVVRLVSYGLGVVLIGLLVIWWQTNTPDTMVEQVSINMAPEPENESGVEGEDKVQPVIPAKPMPQTAVKEVAVVTNVPQPEKQLPKKQLKEEQVVQDVEVISSTTVAESVIEPPAGPQSKIILHFSAESWLEVKDANGTQLEYELMREGRRRELVGVAPFSIFLGNAQAVKMEYNGKPHDISPYIRGNLAQFKVGRAGDIMAASDLSSGLSSDPVTEETSDAF